MMLKMKGIVGIIVIGAMAILLGGAIYLSTSVGIQKTFSIALKEVYVLKTINQLESIKQFLRYPIFYSFSQAIYDVAKHSGYCGYEASAPSESGIYYWRVKSSTYFPDYIESLEKCLKKYLNEYADSLDIPKYKEVKIDENEGKISVIADSMMSRIANNPTIVAYIEANPNRTMYFDKNVLSVFKTAKNLYIDNDIIKDTIIDKIKDSCKKAEKDYLCSDGTKTVAEIVHEDSCGLSWESNLENEIENAINSLDGTYGNVYITHEVKSVEVSYIGSCNYQVTENKETGIAICINDTDSYNCGCSEDPCCENPTQTIPCLECGYAMCKVKEDPEIWTDCGCTSNLYDCCSKPYAYSKCTRYENIKCDYTNHAKVKVLVKVYYPASDDKSLFYPIYDNGKRKLSKIVLQFYVNETVYS